MQHPLAAAGLGASFADTRLDHLQCPPGGAANKQGTGVERVSSTLRSGPWPYVGSTQANLSNTLGTHLFEADSTFLGDLREIDLMGRQFTWANSLPIPSYDKLDQIIGNSNILLFLLRP